jgi:hypothetical protein
MFRRKKSAEDQSEVQTETKPVYVTVQAKLKTSGDYDRICNEKYAEGYDLHIVVTTQNVLSGTNMGHAIRLIFRLRDEVIEAQERAIRGAEETQEV